MREHGMSIRSIAAATGLHRNTVNKVAQNMPPADVVGADGKTYAARVSGTCCGLSRWAF